MSTYRPRLSWRPLTRWWKQTRYDLKRLTSPRFRGDRERHTPQPAGITCQCGANHSADGVDWSGINRPIIFTYRHGTEWAAAIQLRAFQVSRLLVQLGSPVDVIVQPIENLARSHPTNSVIIVGRTAVRPASAGMIRRFIRDGNLVAFDMVDGEVSASIEHLPHAYVCSSLSEAEARTQAGHRTIVSLISPDHRCPVVGFDNKPFGMGYHGLAKNVQHTDALPDVTVVDYREEAPAPGELPMPVGLDAMSAFSHHYSVRAWNPGDGFKPLMKAFVASRLGACFIGSREDREAELVLPDHYPYLAASSGLEDVRAIVDYARETYLTQVWEDAVSTMVELRQRSCPFSTASALVRGVAELIGRVPDGRMVP